MSTCCLTLTLPPVNRDWRHRWWVLHQSGEAHRRRRSTASYCGNRGNPRNQPRLQSKPSLHPSNLAGRAVFTGICHGGLVGARFECRQCPPLTNGRTGGAGCPGRGFDKWLLGVIPGLITHLITTWLLLLSTSKRTSILPPSCSLVCKLDLSQDGRYNI